MHHSSVSRALDLAVVVLLQADELEVLHGKVVFRNPSWKEPLLNPNQLETQRQSVAMIFGDPPTARIR